jgi:hypothetical protein
LRSNAHAVSPVFAKEFKEFWVAPPSAGRTVLFWRRRFEIPCDTNFQKGFAQKYKKNFVIFSKVV